MPFEVILLLLAFSTPGDLCAASGLEKALLSELNAARQLADQETVAPHPVLCQLARDEAAAVAARGGTPTEAGHINSVNSKLYRSGYAPHSWTEGALIAVSDEGLLEQWRSVRPEWLEEVQTGDFEHVGLGFARYGSRLVVSLVLALRARTVEWRSIEPLRDLDRVREIALEEVNRLRREAGRDPLVSNRLLDMAALGHAQDMLDREYYDHVSPEGTTPKRRVRDVGYSGGRIAENIAKGPFSPDEVVRRWMNSSGHRRNLLRRKASEIGFGVAFGVNSADEFEVVWVQVFGER